MERNIGEIFEFGGDWYQCVESYNCRECSHFTTECSSGIKSDLANKVFGECSKTRRSDNKSVIFKKLEKVGEPYEHYEKFYQCYKLPTEIEIKQTKEDMEEKKLNLKPFDIQKAKAGKPVCTRDGRKARIICFDLKNDEYPIVAAVGNDSSETLFSYTTNGEIADGIESDKDLMMLPEKKEGWVNIDKGGSGKITISSPYSTKEEAIHNDNETTIDTIKISWEE